ncbi:transcription factor S [Candidatus Marsarchaeota G1 archaeon OSP_C]|jgi:transcription factor S, archaeal|uniref:Transcription factor S n=1 Tax=Candidatus Marsarchaeota G1 archaeon OSP_C TaxID=1978154 RepID=A0A2R6AT62_9ARCH|nr:MAG: transcription factor S [Candidatus Marsarchaeota G1 archaeon OSP_C]
MKFCPNCGKLLRIQRQKDKIVYFCTTCGKISEENVKSGLLNNKPRQEKQAKIIDSSSADTETLPKTRVICPKCGNAEAYWWMQQTRAADEASTRFFKCVNCGNVWREYD